MTEAIVTPKDLPETPDTFESLGLDPDILKCIEHVGFKHPTPIQKAVIPTALGGKDVIGLAQTGSGKTAAFSLPLSQRLTHGQGVRGLILCPTREIALQTVEFLKLFGEKHHLTSTCLIGGMRMGAQLQDLKKNPDIVVATPGRLVDHMERRTVDLRKIEELVLDEADHMLDLGFLPQIETILRTLPRERHTMMFSATMPSAIERLAQRFLNNPIRIDVLPEGKAAEGITHKLYLVWQEDRMKCLEGLLKEEKGSTLIFARRKIDAEGLSRMLERTGHQVERIHSDLSQKERIDALQGFKSGEHRILVATDIASRGIDIPDIQHVINYDVPETVEDYIHRAGRTARASAIGTVSTVATWMDLPMLKDIEVSIGKPINRCTVEGVKPFTELKKAASSGGRRRRR